MRIPKLLIRILSIYLNYFFLILSILFISCQGNQKNARTNFIEKKKFSSNESVDLSNSNSKIIDIEQGCGYNFDFKKTGLKINKPSSREIATVKEIFSYSGLPSNFILYEAEIGNAIATIINEHRYIVYDKIFFENVDKNTSSYWSSMSILAHEVGHHLSGHTLLMGENRFQSELEADKYSGFILYKMGATLEESLLAIKKLGGISDSKTHPSMVKRINAIKDGWYQSNTLRYQEALPPPPNDDGYDYRIEFTSPMLINKKHISYAEEIGSDVYTKKAYLKGIITEVNKNFNFFNIRILKTSDEFIESWRDLTGEEWKVTLDEIEFLGENEMCHACEGAFKGLITPGRRLKFSMVESFPGGGSSTNGVWFLNYAKGLNGNDF
jgi:hypothetical protein